MNTTHSRGTRTARPDGLRALRSVPGLALASAHHGTVHAGHVRARVDVESPDRARFTARAVAALAAADALRASAALPGNVRFAWAAEALDVVGDAFLGGALAAPVPRTVDWIIEGIVKASRGRPRHDAPEAGRAAAPDLREALRGLGGEGDAVVERGDGLEVRPRLAGAVVAVRVGPGGGGVRAHRVLASLPPGAPIDAVADLALRWNARLRFGRFAIDGDRLVAESIVPSDPVERLALATAVRAVAAASHAIEEAIACLLHDDRAARAYAAALLAPRSALPSPRVPEHLEVSR